MSPGPWNYVKILSCLLLLPVFFLLFATRFLSGLLNSLAEKALPWLETLSVKWENFADGREAAYQAKRKIEQNEK